MRILIVGAGGREHALAWKCAASERVREVIVAPGNAGTALEERVRNAPVGADDTAALVRLARDERVDLTIIGPEAPLVAGIVDAFDAAGLRCFGPRARAAQLEGSKAFSKAFLERQHIPTARHATFTRDTFNPAYLERQRAPLVIKASGLAAGKGVIIAESIAEARSAVTAMFDGEFGAAGHEVVIEEFLPGEEVSFIVVADGAHAIALATSQDHKRRDDGDRGPNTGGMGAYSPAPLVTPALHARIMGEVIEPALRGLAAEGAPYTGFLYAGLMIAPDGTPNVLEFNCRLGDPEAQPLLVRMQSDLTLVCEAALAGRLDQAEIKWSERTALGVVMAAAGYPGRVRTGDPIEGLDGAAHLPGKLFHSGTRLDADGKRVLTSGGRVLCAVGTGHSVRAAQLQAYELTGAIRFAGAHYRRDIGHRAAVREAARAR
jgi:phosphoribosylamine---glycine ligase